MEEYSRAAKKAYSQPSPSDGLEALVATTGTVSSLVVDLAARRAAMDEATARQLAQDGLGAHTMRPTP